MVKKNLISHMGKVKKYVQYQIFGSSYTIIEMNINFITSGHQIDIVMK